MSSQGPNYPSTYNGTAAYGGDVAWGRPDNLLAEDGQSASVTLGSVESSQGLEVTNFGFSIPTSDGIDGILVEVRGLKTGGTWQAGTAYLLSSGSNYGTDKSYLPSSGSFTYDSLGGATDKWGTTPTPAIVNDSSFGFLVYSLVMLFGGSGTAEIDTVRITVYHSSAGGGNFFAMFRKGWNWLKGLLGSPQLALCQQRTIKLRECNVQAG